MGRMATENDQNASGRQCWRARTSCLSPKVWFWRVNEGRRVRSVSEGWFWDGRERSWCMRRVSGGPSPSVPHDPKK